MRNNIYYWKADNPLSIEEKKRSYFKEKYAAQKLDKTVENVFQRVVGADVRNVAPLCADGNHMAYIVRTADRRYFFRADDGGPDDDYMLAESALMRLAADNGVPVPRVYHTDVGMKLCPFRFQIMDCCPDECLNRHHKEGTLDANEIARQLGLYLKRLHAIRLKGFGFINTAILERTGKLEGLDTSYRAYFYKKLDDHLGYLTRCKLLSDEDAGMIAGEFQRLDGHLEQAQGVLVHRDMALWNVLGSPSRITAIIDWDDAVSGDPADDLGVLNCFYDQRFMNTVLSEYWSPENPPPAFRCRMWMHTLRNMLWKTMLRHALGYFDKNQEFFLNTPDVRGSLKDHTLSVIQTALKHLKKCETL